MKVLGREVEMVGLPLAQMMELDAKRFVLAYEIFGQHTYVSNEKLLHDVPAKWCTCWRTGAGAESDTGN